MSKRALLFLSLCWSLLIAGCTFGSGEMASESRQVSGFDEIALLTSGDVDIEVTGTESLEIEAEDNILPLLTAVVTNGRLELGASEPFSTTRRIVYKITAADLVGVTISGSGSVDASGIDTGVFKATISGSGDINPSGSCNDLQVTISGSGRYSDNDLEAGTGTVTVSGSGNADVNVTDALAVNISGSGNVRYTGDPTLSQDISGSGNVSRR